MNRLMRLRLKHGMYWRYRLPGPWDYRQECRAFGAVLLIAFMVWLTLAMMRYERAFEREEEISNQATLVNLACLDQAVRADKFGERVSIGWVVDNYLIGIECTVFDRDAQALKTKHKSNRVEG